MACKEEHIHNYSECSDIVKPDIKPVYTREQLRKQIEVGLDNIETSYHLPLCKVAMAFQGTNMCSCGNIDINREVLTEFLTSHLWGTIGFLVYDLQSANTWRTLQKDKEA